MIRSRSPHAEPEQARQSEAWMQCCLKNWRCFTERHSDDRARSLLIFHMNHLHIQGETNCGGSNRWSDVSPDTPPTDCRGLRFCGDTNNELICVFEYGRHILGAGSSPECVKYALQQVVRDCRCPTGLVAKLINRNFYLDDFMKGVATGEKTFEVYKSVRNALANVGVQLTNWIRNSEKKHGIDIPGR